MSKVSFKDLITEESFKTKKTDSVWKPLTVPVREEKVIEAKPHKPRSGLKSLLDFNEDIKPPVKTLVIEAPISKPIIEPVEPPVVITEIITPPVVENTIEEEVPLPEITVEPSLADLAATHITKENQLEERADSYQQPESSVDIRSFNDVKKRIQFLQDWISKISLAGPGGGASDIINLDMPTTVVTGDYTVTRRDYYVGVNCITTANITLPDPSTVSNGRKLVIKDESGRAQLHPVKVFGTVDNDTGGFEIRINNGGVQLIYRDGWRII
jgi:hypothetical protein